MNKQEAFIFLLSRKVINNESDYVYHSTENIDAAKDIIVNGFNKGKENLVFLDEDYNDSKGYGNFTIALYKKDVESLNLIYLTDIKSEQDVVQALENECDGVKYNWPQHNSYYRIKNIDKLNKLERYFIK